MNKKEIIAQTIADLRKKGLLNEKAVNKHVKNLKEASSLSKEAIKFIDVANSKVVLNFKQNTPPEILKGFEGAVEISLQALLRKNKPAAVQVIKAAIGYNVDLDLNDTIPNA